jgi:hypothetical protein
MDEETPAVGADQEGYGDRGAVGGEKGGLSVDEVVEEAAAVELLAAFAQAEDGGLGVEED